VFPQDRIELFLSLNFRAEHELIIVGGNFKNKHKDEFSIPNY
jgi:hypothetical protein